MSLFEFLMVLVSIIIGLGVAEILTGTANLIRCRDSIHGYWVHGVVVAAIFFAQLQQWWEVWGLRGLREWNFLGLVMMLAGPVGLFLMAHLLFPSPVKGANLKEYYYGAMRPLWWLAAATVALATTFRPLIFDVDLFVPDNATSVALLTAFVTLALSKNKALHAILVPSFFFLILLDIFSWNYVLGEQ